MTFSHEINLKVTRHLNHLSTSAPMPSYAQQHAFANQVPQHVQQYPPFTDYGRELAHINAPTLTQNNRQYWEVARDDSVMFLREPGPSVSS